MEGKSGDGLEEKRRADLDEKRGWHREQGGWARRKKGGVLKKEKNVINDTNYLPIIFSSRIALYPIKSWQYLIPCI